MTMTIYRSPACSCCHLWADIARQRVWTVASADKLDMAAFKAESGVPMEYSSCHTTIVGGYFVEGHVPLEAVERLLAEKPDIDGIALPGMPAGSPGMGACRRLHSRSSRSPTAWLLRSDPTEGRQPGLLDAIDMNMRMPNRRGVSSCPMGIVPVRELTALRRWELRPEGNILGSSMRASTPDRLGRGRPIR